MSGSITKSVFNGATWSGLAQITGQGLRFFSMVILARLLFPEDFGILAMAAIVIGIASYLLDVGFIEVVVQRKNITQLQLSSIFWVIVVWCILICLIIIAISPLISTFFNNQKVGPVLAVSSVNLVIQAVASVHSALLRKRLLFFRSSVADIGDAVGYMAGALPAAFAGLGIWSLVIGNITGNIPGVVLRWTLCGWKPSFTFSFSSLKGIWGFGIKILTTRIVSMLSGKMDYLIIGKFLLPATLGFYSMSLKMVSIPADGLWYVGNRVGLPAFSLVQDEKKRLHNGILKGESFVSIIGVPIFAGLSIVAPELVPVVVGDKWIPSILPMQILCIFGIVYILNIGIPAMFIAKGRPDIQLKINIIQLVILIPALLIGVRFETVGVAIAITAVTFVVLLIRQRYVRRLIGLNASEYLLNLVPAFAASLIMIAAILMIRYILTTTLNISTLVLLICEVLTGAAVYVSVLKISRNPALKELTGLLQEMVRPAMRFAGALAGKKQGNARSFDE